MPPIPDRTSDSRREVILECALETFARAGFRRTSMDDIASAAKISRAGLYFLFDSKNALFRESVSHVLTQDLQAIECILSEDARPLENRLLDAFDRWAARYVGPMALDIPAVIADNTELLDEVAKAAPGRFDALLNAALEQQVADSHSVAQTLSSVSVGLIHQVPTRAAYLERLRVAIQLLLR